MESFEIVGKKGSYRLIRREFSGPSAEYDHVARLTDDQAGWLARTKLVTHLYGDEIDPPTHEVDPLLRLRRAPHGKRWEIVLDLPATSGGARLVAPLPDSDTFLRKMSTPQERCRFLQRTGIACEDPSAICNPDDPGCACV